MSPSLNHEIAYVPFLVGTIGSILIHLEQPCVNELFKVDHTKYVT